MKSLTHADNVRNKSAINSYSSLLRGERSAVGKTGIAECHRYFASQTTHAPLVRLLCYIAMLMTASAISFAICGCRTAASMGLPVSPENSLRSDVANFRESAGHRSDQPTEMAKAALQAHRMEAGDVLVIEPNDFNSPIRLQSDQTVQQDGTIDLGGYGRMYVAGSSAAEIQQKIEAVVYDIEVAKRNRIRQASFSDEPTPADAEVDLGLSVRLVNQESSNIYVMGEVNAPGSYPIDGRETVLDALISAGGLAGNANDHKIILTRPQLGGQPRIILPVCYEQILQLGDVSTNYQLQPGDRIYVPRISLMEDIKQSIPWRQQKSCPHCIDYSE